MSDATDELVEVIIELQRLERETDKNLLLAGVAELRERLDQRVRDISLDEAGQDA